MFILFPRIAIGAKVNMNEHTHENMICALVDSLTDIRNVVVNIGASNDFWAVRIYLKMNTKFTTKRSDE